jgi:hypothetical protein
MARARKVRAVEEARWKSASEMYKLVYDLLKHLTTLSAGASLLLMTLTEKFVKGAAFKSTLGIAMLAFGFATMCALLAMTILSFHVKTTRLSTRAVNWFATGFSLAAVLFLIGMLIVAVSSYRQFAA